MRTNKKIIFILIGTALLALGVYLFFSDKYNPRRRETSRSPVVDAVDENFRQEKDELSVSKSGAERPECPIVSIFPKPGIRVDSVEVLKPFGVVRLLDVEQNETGELFVAQSCVHAPGKTISAATLSPDKDVVLLMQYIGDDGVGWMYDLKLGHLHPLEHPVSGIFESKWLEDGRFEQYYGCISIDFCKKYQSVSSETPWIMKEVER